MKISILGSEWSVLRHTREEDKKFDECGCDGYCDASTRTIVVEKDMTGTLGDMECYARKVIRHEIVHAFLAESGLRECSHGTNSWAENEEMIDWIAKQGPKIYKAWQEAGAL